MKPLLLLLLAMPLAAQISCFPSCSGGGGGTVTAVTGTSPIVSSGGSTPVISAPTALVSTGSYSNPTWLTGIAATIISSGTLSAARLPALTGDATTSAGSAVTTVSKLNGNTPGGTCTNQVVTVISTSAIPTCTTVTSAYVDGSIAPTASPALTGNPTAPTQTAGDSSTKLATDAFVTTAINNAIAGVNPAVAVQAATTAVLPNSPTYSNGASGIGATLTAGSAAALVIDGYTPALNDRLLIKTQASAFQNGVYLLSTLGTGIVPYILTRALDYDQPSDMNNTGAIPVVNGAANAQTSWVLTSSVTTVGTDALTFTQFTLKPTTILTGTPVNHGVPIGTTTQANNYTTAGTAGQVMTSNGPSADPTFQAAGGGVMLTAPVSANWTSFNTSGMVQVPTFANSRYTWQTNTQTGNNIQGVAVAIPTAPYTKYFRVWPLPGVNAFSAIEIGFADGTVGTPGKLVLGGWNVSSPGQPAIPTCANFTNTTTFASSFTVSNPFSNSITLAVGLPVWISLADDNTNWIWSVSYDATNGTNGNYVPFCQVARNTFATPTQLVVIGNGSGSRASVIFDSYQ